MSDQRVFINQSTLKGIADSIRTKTGKTDSIPVTDLASEIDKIETGSSSGTNLSTKMFKGYKITSLMENPKTVITTVMKGE